MKYNIEGYNQQKLIDAGLDCTDAVILRWYADFQLSGKMAEIQHEGEKYYWLKYEYALQEIPIIGIKNKESLFRRMMKLKKAGIIDNYTKRSGGVYSCYRLTEKYYTLVSDSKSTQKSEGIDSKVEYPIDSKVGTKDYSIKDNYSIKDSIPSDKNLHQFIVKIFFDVYEELYKEKPDYEKKDFAIIKNIVEKLQKQKNPIDILENKTRLLYQRCKEEPKFWKFTPDKLLWGWNQLTGKPQDKKQIFETYKNMRKDYFRRQGYDT